MNCPYCKSGVLVEGQGKLDQCGEQYLPCRTFTCKNSEYGGCGYVRYEPVVGAKPICYFPVAPDEKTS